MRTVSSSVTKVSLLGLFDISLCFVRMFLIESKPSSLGMLVYSEVTSRVPMIVLFKVHSVFLIFLMKSEVSET